MVAVPKQMCRYSMHNLQIIYFHINASVEKMMGNCQYICKLAVGLYCQIKLLVFKGAKRAFVEELHGDAVRFDPDVEHVQQHNDGERQHSPGHVKYRPLGRLPKGLNRHCTTVHSKEYSSVNQLKQRY